ncbi:MAG: chromosome partitioning protein ParB [Rhodospirillaceae bacterium]|nr:chromosome partitioning protein ParB [Rhodospirillaceae bacterium]MYK13155.1 chromosome partitioning protein ParB [Rhodospirillaceae bacterium]
MTGRDDGITIVLIPVDRIRVLNPRERDRKKFQEVVDSIERVGLKQPIKVTRLNGSGGAAEYGLVYGQGRLEAFIALGEKEIPAIVADLSEADSLLMSLVENVARRHRRPTELLREIGALGKRGYTDAQIARKIGFSPKYVRGIRRLLEAGEERLLDAVEAGRMPLNVAVDIAAAEDERAQQILADAYESGALSGKQLIEAKRQVERRQRFGKAHLSIRATRGRNRTSSAQLVRALKNQAQQQRLTIKRAEITASRLRLVVQGLHMLLADEHFVTLLRAEKVDTMPAPLARLIEELRED